MRSICCTCAPLGQVTPTIVSSGIQPMIEVTEKIVLARREVKERFVRAAGACVP